MDAAPPSMPEEPAARDWSLLPLDVLCSIFVMLGAVDVLMGAGLVCRSWLQAANLPDVWRVVDMVDDEVVLYEDHEEVPFRDYHVSRAMARAAVDRSAGQLRAFAGKDFLTDELIHYILERSPSLTTLRLISPWYDILSKRLARAIRESPLMELCSLELDSVELTVGELTDLLENCPVLEVLRVRNCFVVYDDDEHALRSKFARIKTMTLQCDHDFRYGSDYGSDDCGNNYNPDFALLVN